ncbi:MAG: mechanosensitive ion channel domain-containing protein [Gammaproteobacteria bacterium]
MRPALLCLLLLCCLGIAPAHGQIIPGISIPGGQRGDAPEARSEPAVATPEPAAIPVERISARLEQARELARRAQEAARPQAEIVSIREQLASLEAQIATVGAQSEEDVLPRLDMRSLETGLDQVTALRRTVSGLQTTLERSATNLSDWRGLLSGAIQNWVLTEQDVQQRELPGEILGNVRGIQATLREADRALRERQDEVLALQGTLAERLGILDGRRAVIEAELVQARADLFRPEHPPIWQGEHPPLALAASQQVWQADWQMLRGYLAKRQANIWVHLGVLVLLLGVFAMLSHKISRWTENKPDLADSLAVLQHSLAAALLLAIISWPWFYPDAPAVLRELFGVLLILPLLRVLPLVVSPSLRSGLYLLAGLYLLLRLNGLLGVGTALERYSLLLLTAGAAAAVAWIFRRGGPGATLEAGRWWSAARLAARLSIVLLAASLLANIAGLVSLAGVLTNAVISSAFAAIVLFGGVVVTRALVIALFQTRLMQRINIVRWHGAAVDHWTVRVLSLLALFGWVMATARLFRIDDVLGRALSAILFSSATIGTVRISLGDILAFVLAIWLGLLVSRMLRFVLSVDIYPRVTLPRGVPATVSMLITYLVLGIAVVFAVAAAGIQLDRFAIIVGALSVGIGFGLQNVVNNFVSGLILAFERPVQSGDTVEFGAMFGKVSRIGVRSSTVRTFDGAEVIVPNANLIANEVTNWTLSDQRRRMEILVGVAYGTNPHKVLDLLLDVARRNDRLLTEPAPSALFLGFGDSSLDFSLRAWSDDFDNYLGIKSELTLAIHDALYAAGFEIPFPQRDLHLRSVDPRAVARIGAVQSPPVGEDGGAETSSASPAES